jgi:hypothetical protein
MIRLVAREDPPAEKNGRGIPVAGNDPDTTAILTRTWEQIIVISPKVKRRLKVSSERNAVRYPRYAKMIKTIKKSSMPINPNSSA